MIPTAHDHGHAAGGTLVHRDVHLGPRRAIQSLVPNISDHADHLPVNVYPILDADRTADWIRVGEITLRGGLAQHGYPWSSGRILRDERASTQERHLHRLEVAGTDDEVERGRQVLDGLVRR